MNVYFSDFFNINSKDLEEYGAFNISLIGDLPLFIDPFLLFNSKKQEYQKLHQCIIKYLGFLRDKSLEGKVNRGLLKSWFAFKEVKQNWLGFSKVGNSGSGLGMSFANALNRNLHSVFSSFGNENITKESHMEKLCLIDSGVGKDNLSDFTTNLIKDYLLEYTQEFTRKYIDSKLVNEFTVEKVRFNYVTESWESDTYILPNFYGDYVILTPRDMLTKDDNFINSMDMINSFTYIVNTIDNESLRAQINNYLSKSLKDDMKQDERKKVYAELIKELPIIIDYYIKRKENNKDSATSNSDEKVKYSTKVYVEQFSEIINLLANKTSFYDINPTSFDEALERVKYLKTVIEDMDGYRIFYFNGQPIKKEEDLQIMYKLTWYSSKSDINAEVNNGRGPVDFKTSIGSNDKTLIEFKLASNTQLKHNLAKQVEVYKKANREAKTIKVILCFTEQEQNHVLNILRELNLNDEAIILIDARKDNKKSASKVRIDEVI
ncbi:hypothetical protein KHQ81_00710 [Mycoplasmatota bacterium]|nr:hypothetical protein KHQ81_00710 [Mycoplasmatota bacterium]